MRTTDTNVGGSFEIKIRGDRFYEEETGTGLQVRKEGLRQKSLRGTRKHFIPGDVREFDGPNRLKTLGSNPTPTLGTFSFRLVLLSSVRSLRETSK